MRLEDLNWMDVENYLEQDDRLMLVMGSCEQHAHLSLLTDVRIPVAIADSASTRTGVLVAPPLNFGFSQYFREYPGTLSLRVPTLIAAVEDLVRSAYHGGFRRLLVLNGHGGNAPVKDHLSDVINDLPGMQIRWYQWWDSHSVEVVARRHNLKPAHANWLEAFPFTIVSDLPEGEKTPPSVPSAIMDAATARQVYGDGSFGGRYRVEDGIMQEVLEAALRDVLALLQFD